MRVLHAYAQHDPARLVAEDAPLPTLGPEDVLVRVHASGVSPGELDWNGTWLRDDGTRRTHHPSSLAMSSPGSSRESESVPQGRGGG